MAIADLKKSLAQGKGARWDNCSVCGTQPLILITTVWFYYEIRILNHCRKTVFILNHQASGLGRHKMHLKHVAGLQNGRYLAVF